MGPSEILFILVLILILFGPDKLPELARKLGKYYRQLNEYKRFLDEEIRKGFLEEVESSDKKRVENMKRVDEDLIAIAVNLGIDPKGKSKDDLLKEIKNAVENRESETKSDADEAMDDE